MQQRPRVATSESSFAHITYDHIALAPSVTAYQDLARDTRHAHQSTWARGPWLTWRALRPGITTRTRVSAVARAGVGEHRALTPNRARGGPVRASAQRSRRLLQSAGCYSRPAWSTGHAGQETAGASALRGRAASWARAVPWSARGPAASLSAHRADVPLHADTPLLARVPTRAYREMPRRMSAGGASGCACAPPTGAGRAAGLVWLAAGGVRTGPPRALQSPGDWAARLTGRSGRANFAAGSWWPLRAVRPGCAGRTRQV
jgi:hypothetical protein